MSLRFNCVAVAIAIAGLVMSSGVQAASAYDFHGQGVNVEYWAGTGSNQAILVLDFGPGLNYAFGYRWNDGDTFSRPGNSNFVLSNPTGQTNTSEALLLAISDAGAFDVAYTYDDTYGFGVDSLTYNANAIVADPFWSPRYPAFYLSGYDAYHDYWSDTDVPAMTGDGVTWVYSNFGAATRILADGYYDGWTQGVDWVASEPVTPLVPEPASVALLAIGGLALLRRRCR